MCYWKFGAFSDFCYALGWCTAPKEACVAGFSLEHLSHNDKMLQPSKSNGVPAMYNIVQRVSHLTS